MRKKQWCAFSDDWLQNPELDILLENITWGVMHQPRPKRKYIRCPVCNKRLMVNWRECEDEGCWHPIISKHKEK